MNPAHVKQRAVVIGRRVPASLQAGPAGRVIGVTSRGVFVQIDSSVIFLTADHFRGPLTINLNRTLAVTNDDIARLSSTRLIFPAVEVDLTAAAVWQPAAPSPVRSIVEQRETLRQLSSSVLARKSQGVIPRSAATRDPYHNQATSQSDVEMPRSARNDTYSIENGFSVLLPHLLNWPEKQALSASEGALLTRLEQLRESIRQQNLDQTTTLIESLLGLGRGLTPSGDDVTIGLLLSVNRRGQERDWRELNPRVIDLARQRTTTLSANLIECAADGEADERLITVIDGLVTGTPSIADCVNCVLDWGSSSGVDALVGMAVAW